MKGINVFFKIPQFFFLVKWHDHKYPRLYEDIHVDVNGKYLTITAEVKQLDEKKDDERVIRSERYYGSISRSVQLPSEVDMKKSSAKYQNGVLDISLGKNANKDLSKIKVT